MTGAKLMTELLYFGISAISLDTTGSRQQGLRASVSFIKENQYNILEDRVRLFNEIYKK